MRFLRRNIAAQEQIEDAMKEYEKWKPSEIKLERAAADRMGNARLEHTPSAEVGRPRTSWKVNV